MSAYRELYWSYEDNYGCGEEFVDYYACAYGEWAGEACEPDAAMWYEDCGPEGDELNGCVSAAGL